MTLCRAWCVQLWYIEYVLCWIVSSTLTNNRYTRCTYMYNILSYTYIVLLWHCSLFINKIFNNIHMAKAGSQCHSNRAQLHWKRNTKLGSCHTPYVGIGWGYLCSYCIPYPYCLHIANSTSMFCGLWHCHLRGSTSKLRVVCPTSLLIRKLIWAVQSRCGIRTYVCMWASTSVTLRRNSN